MIRLTVTLSEARHRALIGAATQRDKKIGPPIDESPGPRGSRHACDSCGSTTPPNCRECQTSATERADDRGAGRRLSISR